MAKSKYTTHVEPHLDKIKEWVRQGDTYKSIAKKLRIGESTFRHYLSLGEQGKEPFTAFLACFIEGETDLIGEVENSLYKRATGYQWLQTSNIYKRDPKTGELVLSERKEILQDVPPDPTSLIFFLTNRKRADWQRDRKEEIIDERDDLGVIMLPEVKE